MMKHMQNLHTHTIYCDGVNTPEELIQEAMRKGFESRREIYRIPRAFRCGCENLPREKYSLLSRLRNAY